MRSPVGFRAMYTASSVGSFLDTVLPGRLGEASKVGVLKVAAGPRWPGFSRAGGSLLCAHLLEMVAFVLVGAASVFFLPVPGWAKLTMIVGLPLAAGGLLLVSILHHKVSHRLPESVGAFLAGAAAPKRIMLTAGLILIVTWVARWFGVLFLLQAVDVHAGVGAALLYMVVTGLANTMPFLPGNVGLYQGAAIGALAMSGHGGTTAVAAASSPRRPEVSPRLSRRRSASRSTAAASASFAAPQSASSRASPDPRAVRRGRRTRPWRRPRASRGPPRRRSRSGAAWSIRRGRARPARARASRPGARTAPGPRG